MQREDVCCENAAPGRLAPQSKIQRGEVCGTFTLSQRVSALSKIISILFLQTSI